MCSVKKVFLEISQNSQENTCSRVSFLTMLKALQLNQKKRICHRCFAVNFAEFLSTPFLTEHLRWLLLKILKHPYFPDWGLAIKIVNDGIDNWSHLLNFHWKTRTRELYLNRLNELRFWIIEIKQKEIKEDMFLLRLYLWIM